MIFFIASFSACPSSTFQVTFLFLNCRLPLFALLAFSSASLAFSLKRIIPYTKRKKKNECFTLQFVVKFLYSKLFPKPSISITAISNASYWILGRNALKVNFSRQYTKFICPLPPPKRIFFFWFIVPPIKLVVRSAHYPSDMEKKIPHLVKRLKDKSKWLSRNYFN